MIGWGGTAGICGRTHRISTAWARFTNQKNRSLKRTASWVRPRASATSASPRRLLMGVRSSCARSAENCERRVKESCRCVRMCFAIGKEAVELQPRMNTNARESRKHLPRKGAKGMNWPSFSKFDEKSTPAISTESIRSTTSRRCKSMPTKFPRTRLDGCRGITGKLCPPWKTGDPPPRGLPPSLPPNFFGPPHACRSSTMDWRKGHHRDGAGTDVRRQGRQVGFHPIAKGGATTYLTPVLKTNSKLI